jgi:penicillin-binding protein 1C
VQNIEIFRPAQDLKMTVDPRIPLEKQMFEMRISGIAKSDEVEWFIDNKKYSKILASKFLWPIQKGKHSVKAVIWRNQKEFYSTS